MTVPATLDLVANRAPASALLHPLRRRLLRALREPDSAAGLARRLGEPRQKLNYHLREMEDQGLLTLVEERPRRGCTERVLRASADAYVLSPSLLGDLAADPDAFSDHFSSAYQAAVAARALSDLSRLEQGARKAGKKLPTFTLLSELRFASAREMNAFAEELSEAVAALVARYHDERAPRGRRFRFFLGAHPKPKAST